MGRAWCASHPVCCVGYERRISSHTQGCERTGGAHCPHNTEGVMNFTPDPGDTGPLVVITVTDTCTENQLCALCRHSAQMWVHCRGARGAACGLEVGSLLTRLWRCLRRGSDDGGTDPSRSALADKRPSRPRKNAKDVTCPPASKMCPVQFWTYYDFSMSISSITQLN